MSCSRHDLAVGVSAARAWLNTYESMYSGMISDDILDAVVAAVVNKVDEERATQAKAQ